MSNARPRNNRRVPMNTFNVADSVEHFDDYRQLAMKYVEWMKATYSDHLPVIDQYYESLLAELATLPGKFRAPDGCLLLVYDDGRGRLPETGR